VPHFGAGLKEVKFFLDNSISATSSISAPRVSEDRIKSKKAPKASPALASIGIYISVFNFFKQSKLLVSLTI
jgi:hypothetical protein